MRNVQLLRMFVPILLIVIVLPVNVARGSATGEWGPEIEPWMSVERSFVTEEIFSPGPLGYSISVDITKPGENVTVWFYAWKHAVDLPGPVEFKLIQIDEEGNFVRVVDQENREIKTVGDVRWRTRVPDVAPAHYKFGVVIRDENGGVFAKLISTLYVPLQELDVTISLNKEEFSSGDNLVYTICNEGPTHISFGTEYTIQYLHESRWILAKWVMPGVWAPVGIELRPGENYSHVMELFPVYAGTYRIVVDNVVALGTDLSTTLAATFKVKEATAWEEIPRASLPEEFWEELQEFCRENIPENWGRKDVVDRLTLMFRDIVERADPEYRFFMYWGGVERFSVGVKHATKEFIERWPEKCHGVEIEIDAVSWALTENEALSEGAYVGGPLQGVNWLLVTGLVLVAIVAAGAVLFFRKKAPKGVTGQVSEGIEVTRVLKRGWTLPRFTIQALSKGASPYRLGDRLFSYPSP